MKKFVTLVLAVNAMTGCYFGRSAATKTAAYVANGTLVAAGTAGIAGSGGDEQQMLTTISAIPLVIGLIGIAINLAVETESRPTTTK